MEGHVTIIMLICCLKQVKYFILKFTITKGFFSEKEFLNLFTMMPVFFPSGECVDEVADNQTNY